MRGRGGVHTGVGKFLKSRDTLKSTTEGYRVIARFRQITSKYRVKILATWRTGHVYTQLRFHTFYYLIREKKNHPHYIISVAVCCGSRKHYHLINHEYTL